MKTHGGNIKVTTEQGHCSFCDRTRNLRREERQLGGLVRVVVTCESCHRTLTSSMGVPAAQAVEAPADEAETAAAAAVQPVAEKKVAAPTKAPAPVKAKKPTGATAKRPAAGSRSSSKKG